MLLLHHTWAAAARVGEGWGCSKGARRTPGHDQWLATIGLQPSWHHPVRRHQAIARLNRTLVAAVRARAGEGCGHA